MVDLHDVFKGKGFKVEAVGGVVIGGDGFRVAVDHHRFVADAGELQGCVDAGVIEFDALPDAVGSGTENDYFFAFGLGRHL